MNDSTVDQQCSFPERDRNFLPMVRNPKDLDYKSFRLLKAIGNGRSGKVLKVIPPEYHEDEQFQNIDAVAMKVIQNPSPVFARMEARIHAGLSDIPFITRLYRYCEYGTPPHRFMLLMELANGPCLANVNNFFMRRGENDCLKVIWEVLIAVSEMHRRGVAHLDIKLENMAFTETFHDGDQLPSIRLFDFGTAQEHLELNDRPLNVYHSLCPGGGSCGTLGYSAPEMEYKEDFSPGYADMWSIGVTLFHLFQGELPYNEDSFRKITRVSAEREPDCSSKNFTKVSGATKTFLRDLLHEAPEHRPTAQEALQTVSVLLHK